LADTIPSAKRSIPGVAGTKKYSFIWAMGGETGAGAFSRLLQRHRAIGRWPGKAVGTI
jgi:hypothetical protein